MGFIGIDRGLREHWIYQDAEYLKVWMEMLFLARFSEEPHNELIDGEIITVNYSEFIYGRIKWSERLKVTEQRLRTLIKKLKTEEMIEVVSEHRKCTLYRMTNYSKFNQQVNQQNNQSQQGFEEDANQQNSQQLTSSQPAANQQLTTKEQGNKVNKDKKVKKEITYSDDFLTFWDSYPKQIGQAAAFNEWKKLIKTIDPSYLIACAMNYSSYVIANNTEIQFIKQPNNFLKPKEEYYKQYETPVLIHNKGGQAPKVKQTATSKLQEMYRRAEEEEAREANGGY